MSLPTAPQARKAVPIATGCVDYFPKALAAVAELSRIGNEQHNPGAPLHWDRSKSTDEADCLMRHFVERGTLDIDGVRHSAKVAWRGLALLEKEIETADAKAKEDEARSANIRRECAKDASSFDPAPFYETPDRFDENGMYATDLDTGDQLPLDGVFCRMLLTPRVKDPTTWNTPHVHVIRAHGFNLGETVNLRESDVGELHGEVVGFDDEHVLVLWGDFDRSAKHLSNELRHGP